ncbi:hypothetical protein E2C01_095496 [Portunus trituberculatus]|uniref:Uncharacterized protein n=1 Tax=Portunus trituberculatus TaxID=210409 RepID=A0A5B7K3Z9_PORTR|nr:hypothetical protein [Portunus trituberculatus]
MRAGYKMRKCGWRRIMGTAAPS